MDFGVGNGAFDLPGLARAQRRKRAQMGMVFVTQRQMQHEIVLVRNAKAGELVAESIARCGCAFDFILA